MEAVGGPQTYVLGGAFNCGKGQPGQVAPVSHGCPSAVFRGVSILNTAQEAGADDRDVAAGARRARPCAAATGDGCVVLAEDDLDGQPALGQQHADHQRRDAQPRRLTVIAIRDGATASAGVVTRSRASTADTLADLVARGRGGGRGRPPGRGRAAAGRAGAGPTPALGRRAGRAPRSACCAASPARSARRSTRRGGRPGAVRVRRAQLTTTYLGTSTGLRLRHDQPTGQARAQRQVGRPGPLGLGRRRPRATSPTSTWPRSTPSAGRAAGLGGPRRSSCPPAATRRCCRRAPSPT